SPDGNVYRRNDNGWYRREAGGGWSYFAATQGHIQENRPSSDRGQGVPGSGISYRPIAGANASAARKQALREIPNSGTVARRQEDAALERQYYARALGQMRAQNWRASGNFSRAARSGGRR